MYQPHIESDTVSIDDSKPSENFRSDVADRWESYTTSVPMHGVELEVICETYEDEPDRCTIAPKKCSSDKRLTTWISANRRVFVDLHDVE